MTAKERHAQLLELFDRLCDLPVDQRGPVLDTLCTDPALRRDVEAMLSADAQPDSPLEKGAVLDEAISEAEAVGTLTRPERLARALFLRADPAAPTAEGTRRPLVEREAAPDPERVGPYRVLRRLGSGGMGTVYEAEQDAPRRKVALKVVHPWLLSDRVVQRFRFESDALAQLQHPGIPKVYAVGEADGCFYFAMELITGRALLEGPAGASLAQRVRCLALIADAVHHAHLRGFLHRDLKPENIRVGEDDQPRVLDFGISTVIEAESQAREVELSGTLAYMSPEQVAHGMVDVRSDVFSLGLIGFELLGAPRARQLSDQSLNDALRVVREEKVKGLAEVLPGAPFELCAILDRAVAHDPAQRYGSADELAADLRRFLRGEAVEAIPRSPRYRARVFLRQHRTLALATFAVMLALVVGATASFFEYRRAEAARAQEAKERAQAEATVGFLEQLLLEAHPNRALGRDLTLREALDRAGARLDDGALKDTPAVEVRVRHTLSDAYHALGHWDQARAQLAAVERKLNEGVLTDEALKARLWAAIAELEIHHGTLERAQSYAERAVAVERRLRPGGEQLGEALQVVAELWREQGQIAKSEAAYREVWALRERLFAEGKLPLEEVTASMNQLAIVLAMVGREDEAARLFAEALRRDTEKWGPDHPEIATGLHDEAWLENLYGHSESARKKLVRARAIREATLGKDHPRLGAQRMLEAELALEAGDVPRAHRYVDEGLRLLSGGLTDAPMMERYRLQKAQVLREEGDLAGAEHVAREVTERYAQRYGDHAWRTAEARAVWGDLLRREGRRDEGCAMFEAAVRQLSEQLGERSPYVARARRLDPTGACRALR